MTFILMYICLYIYIFVFACLYISIMNVCSVTPNRILWLVSKTDGHSLIFWINANNPFKQRRDTQHNDTPHNNERSDTPRMLSITTEQSTLQHWKGKQNKVLKKWVKQMCKTFYIGTEHFKKCKRLFEYQHWLLLRDIWWSEFWSIFKCC